REFDSGEEHPQQGGTVSVSRILVIGMKSESPTGSCRRCFHPGADIGPDARREPEAVGTLHPASKKSGVCFRCFPPARLVRYDERAVPVWVPEQGIRWLQRYDIIPVPQQPFTETRRGPRRAVETVRRL